MDKTEREIYYANYDKFFQDGLNNLSPEPEGYNEFSTMPCQCCKTHLAGERYACNGYNEKTKEIEEYDSICENCVYVSANGCLPDEG